MSNAYNAHAHAYNAHAKRSHNQAYPKQDVCVLSVEEPININIPKNGATSSEAATSHWFRVGTVVAQLLWLNDLCSALCQACPRRGFCLQSRIKMALQSRLGERVARLMRIASCKDTLDAFEWCGLCTWDAFEWSGLCAWDAFQWCGLCAWDASAFRSAAEDFTAMTIRRL